MSRALVLNASYEPLSVVSARRAVVLILRDKADLLEPGDEVWHAESLAVPVPSVIRLRTFIKVPYARRVPLNRRAVFIRDENRCQYCDGPAENLDHVVPRSLGGAHTWENVVACCRGCNGRKGSGLPGDVRLRLIRPPKAPRRHGWVLVAVGSTLDPRWHPYIWR